MIKIIIHENYINFYQLVSNIFESALLSPTYALHILLNEQVISEALYLRTEFENWIYSFLINDP